MVSFNNKSEVDFLFKMPPTNQKLVCIIFKYLHMLKMDVKSRPANSKRYIWNWFLRKKIKKKKKEK